MPARSPAILAALALSAGPALAAPTQADIAGHASGIWSIDPAGRLNRWIVIHGPAGGGDNGVYHIEVLGNDAKAPAWKTRRLAPHMAATLVALLNSVRKPLQRGLVYPEQYEDGLARWKQQRSEGKAEICSTSIDRCLRNSGKIP
jgi:hypothetical protein